MSPTRPVREATPAVNGRPAISKHSLTRMGTPQRGATLTGGARPAATAASAASASLSASSKRRAVSALSDSSARKSCCTHSSVSARDVSSPRRIWALSTVADWRDGTVGTRFSGRSATLPFFDGESWAWASPSIITCQRPFFASRPTTRALLPLRSPCCVRPLTVQCAPNVITPSSCIRVYEA